MQPVVSIDRLPVSDGDPGRLTRTLQQLYEAAVRAEPAYRKWSTPVCTSESRLRAIPA